MRNLLALVGAFTLSTSSCFTVVACGSTSNTTTTIFDWNSVINGETGKTSDEFFQWLLDNPDNGLGGTLYKDIVDYTSLSILKTDDAFSSDYQFAKQAVENQIQNIENSLQAKYGRSWASHWKDFLKDPAQGGDGSTGSYERYFDVLLKSKATDIVSQYYVGDNYHNYQYYNSTEISIWLADIYSKVHPSGGSMSNYLANGTYKDKVWIVAGSHDQADSGNYPTLETAIKNASSASSVSLPFKVAKTKNDKPLNPGDDYLVDPSKTINGLLSDQQAKIAKIWMKNQGPIWARQIVIPFNASDQGTALKKAIDASSFTDSTTQLKQVITNIKTNGFTYALKQQMGSITSTTTSKSTGDLGLVTLNSDSASIKSSFSYYMYRYVTSEQGIGESTAQTVTPYQLAEYTAANPADLTTLFSGINRTVATPSPTQTSNYNDLVWMKDGDTTDMYSGNGAGAAGNKVAIFIDEDGIHFVQTPGITYQSTVSTDSTQKIITDFNQKISNGTQQIVWDDAAKLSDRPGGLTNNPYLDYLQTQYLVWTSNGLTPYFDLNNSLKTFTSGSTDIASDTWWDYILYFNDNIDKVHWNISNDNSTLSTLLNDNIKASTPNIDSFIQSMRTWFLTTFNRRWSLHQGISNTDTLIKNINAQNDTWNGYPIDAPAARLDASDIKSYLNNVASQTIWWYDPNSIQQ